ncbi:hypothetical protein Hanom_Chr12g01139471 [Helianthus anomalus]
MENEFYKAFATASVAPVTVTEIVSSENETGTPLKLMYIEDFKGWQDRFLEEQELSIRKTCYNEKSRCSTRC